MAPVGIVIPALDPDPERLVTYIEALESTLSPARIHVELDRPTRAVEEALDATTATVRTATERRGKGRAIAEGFDALDTDILAFVDADGSTPPDSLSAVLSPVEEGHADLAVGSRRHPDAEVRIHQSRLRRRLGDLFVHVARVVLPVRLYDYQCGAKAIRASTWRTIREDLVSPGFAWDIEFVVIAHARGARVEEVPIVWDDKPGSTVALGGTVSTFATTLVRAWHRAGLIRGDRVHRTIDRLTGAIRGVSPSYRKGRPEDLAEGD